MAAQPNLKGVPRFAYVVAGLTMMALGFFYVDPGFWRYTLPVVGAGVLISGLIGYCPVKGMLGLGAQKRVSDQGAP